MPKNTTKIHNLSMFIFRRDLRLEDNTALFHSLRLSQQVVPCFVFDTDQIDPKKNSFFSHNCVQFMIESLKDLNTQLSAHKARIFFFHGEKKATFKHMLDEIKPDAVFINEDYTAYAKSRDNLLEKICDENSVKFYTYNDINMLPKDKVLLSGGQFYKKFTAYYNAALHFPIPKPEHNSFTNYYPASKSFKGEYDYDDIDKFYENNDDIEVHGGRKEAMKILDNIQKWKDYGKQRDCAAYPTTKLSAYNKFGCVSIREEYHIMKDNFGANCSLIRQLFWRDFYHNVAYYNPHVFGDAFKDEYRNVYFSADSKLFDKWTEGKTGCPIVDAAMRQLNTTGYMPNRLRLITSNYLIKDLLIDWRKGEKYFAQHLVDYDPCNNNGNWQWSAGSGADAQPYFRIFNPKLQSEKFDKDCEYILKWVPELKGVESNHIHHWDEHYKEYKGKVKYPDPIVFHDVQKKKCLKMYKQGLYGEKYEEEDDKEGIESEDLGSIGEEEELEGKEEKKPSKKRKAQEPITERPMKKNKINSEEDVDEAMKEQEAKKVQLKIGEKRGKSNARSQSQSHQKDKIKVNNEKKGKGKAKDKENEQMDDNEMEVEDPKGNGRVTRSRSKKVK